QSSRIHRDLHSFPTRRSSDLGVPILGSASRGILTAMGIGTGLRSACIERDEELEVAFCLFLRKPRLVIGRRCFLTPRRMMSVSRSEEHTSELQSRGHLVCRLL